MKLKHVAVLSTAVVIIAGFAMISPLFIKANEEQPRQTMMLCISITRPEGVMDWSEDLANVLFDQGIGASLFVVGKVAEDYPDAVWFFNDKVDVGSQTYSNVNLTEIPDYLEKLEEVKEGKAVVDDVGALDSRLFRAPFGATDQDIYSLLSRSGILADFSYQNYYNVFRGGQFVKCDARTFMVGDISPPIFTAMAYSAAPVIIFLDDTQPVSEIDRLISTLKARNVKFVNASELTGLNLTTRGS